MEKKLFSLASIVLLLVLCLPLTSLALPAKVRLLYVNDFHGFANPVATSGKKEPAGGAAWLAARIKARRGEAPSLLLAAGDMISGNSWANLFQGESVIALMNLIGFDAMVVGNHEFDYGPTVLERRIAEARFPMLGANVTGMAGLRPYVIREVAGLRVAIVGLVTDDTPITSHPRNTKGLTFLPPLPTADRLIRDLQGKSDLIVLLTHIGHGADRDLAAALPGNLVIIGGHTHTKVERPVRIGTSVVVQAWEHGEALGVLDVTVDGGRVTAADGRLEEITAVEGKNDRETQLLVDTYNARFSERLGEKAGESAVELDAARVRRQETNFGDLVADVIRQAAGADAAIVNGGTIRAGIRRGPVLVRDIYAALPFDNYIVTVRMSGAEVRQALEHGVSAVERGEGRFPQVSGMTFGFSPQAPPGKRIREVRVGGLPLEEQKEYLIATTDFVAAGGDGYRVFAAAMGKAAARGTTAAGNAPLPPECNLRDLVVDYLRQKGSIAPQSEGRIRELP